ncbi:MAG: serine acetyltransferase [Bacteroidaceae bacterium]|nr:serine acetyltransferase [Bacteroidaceae bacterium]
MLIHWYRFNHWLWKHHVPFLPWFIWRFQYLLFNCSVPASCKLGKGTSFGYGGIGVIIHGRAVLGRNCSIGANVSIGGKSGWYEVPVIGDNVSIAAGAKILGPVLIGDNVIIGANSVITKDVPSNCVVAGIPAKIIRCDINTADYSSAQGYKYRGENGWPVTPNR